MGTNTDARLLGLKDDGTIAELKADAYSNALLTTTLQHYRIHKGDFWEFSAIFTVGIASITYFLGTTGIYPVHFSDFTITVNNGPIYISLWEDATVSANGTVQTTQNRNRTSVEVPTFAVYSGPTVIGEGTRLFIDGLLNTGLGAQRISSYNTTVGEWILKPNSNYLFKIDNSAGATAVNAVAEFLWYEQR